MKFAQLCKPGPDPKSISRLLSWGWGLGAGHRKARCSPPVLIIPQSLPRKFPNAHTSHPEIISLESLGAVCHLPLIILDRVASGQTRGAISNVAQLLRRVGKVSLWDTAGTSRLLSSSSDRDVAPDQDGRLFIYNSLPPGQKKVNNLRPNKSFNLAFSDS